MWRLDRQRERLNRMFGRVFDTTTVDRVTGLIRPGLRLVTGEDVAVGRSHLGGLPRLDGTAPWPTHFETPLDLLAVIDVAELGPCDLPGLPAGTRFPNFFFLADRPELLWTSDEPASTWRVVPAGPDAKERTAPVERLVRPARPVGFVPVLTLPTWEDEVVARTLGVAEGPYPPSPRYHLIERYSAVTAAWNELVRDHLGAVENRIGGWPAPLQAPVFHRAERDSASHRSSPADGGPWRLLLQLDTNDDSGWSWGDGGRLYFVITESRLRAGELTAAWLELQSS
ncbi:MAG: YwqG family protein [Saccharomonospora viridis]|jgi:hypothetical protein|uniref:YwqG family protein n=1 Tax=Saccharomonospora viridis TaxID=1852 RepID=UPI002409AB37|nr:YwqG family protein [Saccharomonospora viridis]